MLLLGLSWQHFLVEVVVFSLIAKRTLFSLIAKKEGEIGCTKWFRLQNSTERKRLKREDPSKDMLLCKTEGMLVPLIVVVTFALDRLCSQRIVWVVDWRVKCCVGWYSYRFCRQCRAVHDKMTADINNHVIDFHLLSCVGCRWLAQFDDVSLLFRLSILCATHEKCEGGVDAVVVAKRTPSHK